MQYRFKFLLLLILMISNVHAHSPVRKLLSVDFQDVELRSALHILGKFFHQNILLSPSLHGTTSLYLNHASQEQAFNLILTAHHLEKQMIDGNTWLIAPEIEFNQRLEEKMKHHAMLEATQPLIIKVWRIYYAKVDELAKLLTANNQSLLSARGQLHVDVRTNTLCILDTETHLHNIAMMIKHLDVPVQQVLIEARLMSVDRDFERELGINFATQTNEATPTVPQTHYHLAIARLSHSSQLDIQLAALENQGHGEIISTPSLFTANRQSALIESGEEIPYQETSEGGGTAVTFKKAVLSLKVTPQILPNNKVLLQLQVNQDRPNHRIVLGVPAISTRQISTRIMVRHGQTIVLGGIYETNEEHSVRRIPFLGKIPLVGWLFKQENVKNNKRELLIFVTPKIIPFQSK